MNNVETRIRRNGKIEIMRFVFCLCVLFYHCNTQLGGVNIPKYKGECFTFFYKGYIGVEFFYIVSGYLMGKSILKAIQKRSDENVPAATVRFVLNKYLSIFPLHILAFLILLVYRLCNCELNVAGFIRYIFSIIPNALMLNTTGLDVSNLNHVEWYIGSMLMAMFFLYPIVRLRYEWYTKVIGPIVAITIMGVLSELNGGFTGNQFTPLGSVCFLRAVAGLSLGIVSFEIVRYMNTINFSKFGNRLLRGIEYICYIIIMLFVNSHMKSEFDGIITLIVATAITLSFSDKKAWGDKYNNKLIHFLGKSSLPIYLVQLLSFYIISEHFVELQFRLKVAMVVGITFVTAYIVQILEKQLQILGGKIRVAMVDNSKIVE